MSKSNKEEQDIISSEYIEEDDDNPVSVHINDFESESGSELTDKNTNNPGFKNNAGIVFDYPIKHKTSKIPSSEERRMSIDKVAQGKRLSLETNQEKIIKNINDKPLDQNFESFDIKRNEKININNDYKKQKNEISQQKAINPIRNINDPIVIVKSLKELSSSSLNDNFKIDSKLNNTLNQELIMQITISKQQFQQKVKLK